jgi:hypothetical protein
VHPHCCVQPLPFTCKKGCSKMASCNRVNKAKKTHSTLLGSTIPQACPQHADAQHADAQEKHAPSVMHQNSLILHFRSRCKRVAPAMGTWV